MKTKQFLDDLIQHCRAHGGVDVLTQLVADKVIPQSVYDAIRPAVEDPKAEYVITVDEPQLTSLNEFVEFLDKEFKALPPAVIEVWRGWMGHDESRYWGESWTIVGPRGFMTRRPGGLMFLKKLHGYPCVFSLNGQPIEKSDLFTKLGINETETNVGSMADAGSTDPGRPGTDTDLSH